MTFKFVQGPFVTNRKARRAAVSLLRRGKEDVYGFGACRLAIGDEHCGRLLRVRRDAKKAVPV